MNTDVKVLKFLKNAFVNILKGYKQHDKMALLPGI